MSTNTTSRRALLAMAGATTALASVLAPTAGYAAPAAQPRADAGTGVRANPAVNGPAVQTVHMQQRSAADQSASAALACTRRAKIDGDRAANRYKVSGSISCNANGFLRMRCKPVHRHTFNWHSHAWAFDVTRFGRSLSQSSGLINGTNGDTYKANCQYWFNGRSLGTVESGTITL